MIGAEIRGIPDLNEALRDVPQKLRRGALRNALAAGARVVRDGARNALAARARAPVLSPTLRNPRRKPGTVKKALAVRTSKAARSVGDVGVFVNVRPAKGAEKGANSPNDPFYWRWLNFGWNPANRRSTAKQRRAVSRKGGAKTRAGIHFLEAGVKKFGQALDVFVRAVGPAIEKAAKK